MTTPGALRRADELTVALRGEGEEAGAGLGEGAARVVALGGMAEIGMNCTLLERPVGRASWQQLMIDCGVTFPFGDDGRELVHPRFDAVRADDLAGVVLTHGHEDHIGGLPYLLATLGRLPPVWGRPYTLELVARRLDEHGYRRRDLDLRALSPGQVVRIGAWGVEPVRVAHSIPHAVALAIDTGAGRLVHMGDFKLDDTTPESTDADRLRALGDDGVRFLLSDSTNALARGRAGAEGGVVDALDRHVGAAAERVVVGLFASNVYRMCALGAIARRHGRKVCLLGRSMRNHAEAARALGLQRWPSDLLVSPAEAQALPRGQLLVLATGTQAEARASLRRLAERRHDELALDPGDEVILSSRVIPGAEREVYALLDGFVAQGVRVATGRSDPSVHASGHAQEDDLRDVIRWLRPTCFVPTHGTRLHLARHAEIAADEGVPHVLVAHNGDVVDLSTQAPPHIGAQVVTGVVARQAGRVVGHEVLEERRRLGREGMVTVVLVDRDGGPPACRVSALGIERTPALLAAVERAVLVAAGSHGHTPAAEEQCSRAARRVLRRALGYGPAVDVVWC